MKEHIAEAVTQQIAGLQEQGVLPGGTIPTVTLERPTDMRHGAWTSNIGFVCAKTFGMAPADVTRVIAEHLHIDDVEEINPIGGYINFVLARHVGQEMIRHICTVGDDFGRNSLWEGKKVMVEYTDPNPFKVFHIGHLMPNVIGESLATLFTFSGAEVLRVNYQGDVGLHVAKSLWGIQQNIADLPRDEASLSEKTAYLGTCYAAGNAAYEKNDDAKGDIIALNKTVYAGDDENLMALYHKGRSWSLAHFEEIYALLGTTFDHYFFESETWERGKEVVEEHLDTVFEESDGAVIFDGDKHGLHKRVFITQEGLTTYEAKDIGLAMVKRDYAEVDLMMMVTGVEQKPYFQVIYKALELLDPYFTGRFTHIAHGLMQLKSGKMSSRSGNVITGESLLQDAQEIARAKVDEQFSEALQQEAVDAVAVAGVKFSILKQSLEKNMTYDHEQALSFDGDSGPYLQYTYARIQSILRKASQNTLTPSYDVSVNDTIEIEKILMLFPETVEHAMAEYAPHHVANYLLELARAFNAYYAQTVIVSDDAGAPYRLAVAQATSHVLKNGLTLLGIKTLEKM